MRSPVFRGAFAFPGELVVDNFAGGGGASTGIEAAINRPVDIAINHSPEAIAMHKANHPQTKHYCEDIFAVDPVEACAGRPVGLAWFSPDCFPAGTLVLTREGYRPIEEIEVGDEVLTHELRWRPVTATMSSTKPLIRVRGHGHPGLLVSPEHPFWIRNRTDSYANRKMTRYFAPSSWRAASDLGPNPYWATPAGFPSEQPPAIPVYRQRETGVNAEIMWLVGRYVADGWTRLTATRAELVITCGHHETEELRQRLSVWPRAGARAGSGEIAWQERDTGTAHQFTCAHRGLVEWLREHFGHGAAEKLIPGWALGMHKTLRQALLDGYLSGDGWRGANTGRAITECFTVSKALAFGLKALAASLGKTVAVYTGANRDTIEGRKVNARPYWQLRWRDDLVDGHRQTIRESDVEWSPIRDSGPASDGETVFNLSVAEDESYIVEGIIVHNCTHFSRAKGTTPVSKEIRGLAWVVVNWAKTVSPRVIVLENVEEFQTWGPLGEDGRPDPLRAGETFREWLAALSGCGYAIEFKSLVAADYGAPTTRKRLFLVARRDGRAIVWPEATHGKGRPQPWRTAAEIIDWSLPCPSIFERKRPLVEATLARIAKGIRKFVIDNPRPFIVPVMHGAGELRSHSIAEPLRTITAAHRGEFAIVDPFITRVSHGEVDRRGKRRGKGQHALGEPLPTVTASNDFALAAPFIVRHGHYSTITGAGLREGCGAGTFRGQELDDPLATVCATNDKHLVLPFVAKHYGRGGTSGSSIGSPLGTVTDKDHNSLAAAFLTKFYGTSTGAAVDAPAPTITSGGERGGGHLAEVRAFLLKYYGGDGKPDQQQDLFDPLHTVTSRARFGLVMVAGEAYEIVDIGMRMLRPHELFAAQGFPGWYQIAPEFNGKPLTITAQTSCVGNSVSPPPAEKIVAANARAA